MDYKAFLALSLPIAVAIAAFGSAVGLGKAVAGAMDATGRQPEASVKILITLAVGGALIEALTIYALVLAFVMGQKI